MQGNDETLLKIIIAKNEVNKGSEKVKKNLEKKYFLC